MSARPVVLFLSVQLAITMLMGVVVLSTLGVESAKSALLGCGVILIANTYFAISAFRFGSGITPEKAVMTVYRAQSGRYILVSVLFAMTFQFAEVNDPLIMCIASAVIILTQIVASVLLVSNPKID